MPNYEKIERYLNTIQKLKTDSNLREKYSNFKYSLNGKSIEKIKKNL